MHNREPMCSIEPAGRREPPSTDNFAEFWKSLPRPDDRSADDLEEVNRLFRKLPRLAWEKQRYIMGGLLVVDTSVLAATECTGMPLNTLFETQPGSRVGVWAITVSELLHGFHRARTHSER